MPYIGLCGLLPVSLSERAQKIVPFTFARVAAEVFDRMPRRNALSEWKREAELGVHLAGVARRHVRGQPELRVALAP